jgi:outer membrane protein assembly factor BamB
VAITTTDPGRESVRVVGVDPAAGKLLWRSEPWPEKWGAACVDPVIYGGSLFVTTAEQHQRGARFTIQGQGLRHDWSTRSLSGYTGGVIYWRDHLYGVNRLGRLVCLDWRSGEERWSQPGFDGFGSLIAADGHLLVQTGRRGDLVLAAADPAGYRELRRCRVFEGRPDTFTAPVLANGRIYCRSYEGEVVCLTLTW